MSHFSVFREKLEQANVSEAAIKMFEKNYAALCENETGIISEDAITPVQDLVSYESIDSGEVSKKLLSECVVIKLNGGLGTSMGLQKAKSLLTVRDGKSFLDLIVEQLLNLKDSSTAEVNFLFMNSFSTSADTLNALAAYKDRGVIDPTHYEFIQNQVPKIDAETLMPAEYPSNRQLEWCPPGHGDIYAAFTASGILDKLLNKGVKYAFVSNADNLGATLDTKILNYFSQSELPFLMEATKRTAADKKGGHLAIRNIDNQMLLREVAQTSDLDLAEFQNISKHQYFNTNNLWVNLAALKDLLNGNEGIVPLPMIKNKKTVNPRDKSSTAVFQLEVAMGAAIECFEGASAISVPRSRFAPVKATSDLFLLRSDVYTVDENFHVKLSPERNRVAPLISLSDEYKLVDSLDSLGMPSLINADSLKIEGLVKFSAGVEIKGNVEFVNNSATVKTISAGVYSDQKVVL